MTEKKCQLTEKLRNYVYRYGTELSDDKLKKMGVKTAILSKFASP